MNPNEVEFLRIKRDQSRNLLEAAKRLKLDNDKIDELFINYCDSVEAYCLAVKSVIK